MDRMKALKVYAYFNNDVNAFAINNAKYLISLYVDEPSEVK